MFPLIFSIYFCKVIDINHNVFIILLPSHFFSSVINQSTPNFKAKKETVKGKCTMIFSEVYWTETLLITLQIFDVKSDAKN